ncbi:phosphopantetheine-binding protein [Streptomyces sp. NPDC006265]|uniref:phosphopantetheine-binding protein n=1 Tax=Streptomyces sp. NPDC006265 TaxID=3156740 RepID=UPI0033B43859
MLIDELDSRTRAIWEKVLGTEVDGATDFFDVGGHSFMAMQIMAMLEELCDCPLPMSILFDHSRFDEFVAALADELGTGAK